MPPSPASESADHPRIRGEHAAEACECHLLCRIIPAYAGSTRALSPGGVFSAGSSPHTRGARYPADARRRRHRIIPAYAGSTSCRCPAPRSLADHPRIRGEHLAVGQVLGVAGGSSPHTRGAHGDAAGGCHGLGIIPAYAGSTQDRLLFHVGVGDHPRIRGEHGPPREAPTMPEGSSPHTRGALLEIPAIPRIAAVIIPVFLYPSPTPQEEADRSMVLLTLS